MSGMGAAFFFSALLSCRNVSETAEYRKKRGRRPNARDGRQRGAEGGLRTARCSPERRHTLVPLRERLGSQGREPIPLPIGSRSEGFRGVFSDVGGKRVVRNDSSLRPGPCSLRGNESLGFSRLYCGASGGDPSALKGPGKFSSSRPNRFGDVAGSPPSVCGGSYFVPKDRARPAAGAVANPFRNPCGLRVRRTMRRLRAVHFNRPRRTANASGPGGTGFGVVRRSCVRGLSA